MKASDALMEYEKNNRLYIFYLATAILFLLLKLYHSSAGTDELRFLIRPVAAVTALVTGTSPVYEPGNGYFFRELGIVIDKSCSGFNFGCICLLILNFLVFRDVASTRGRLLFFPIGMLCAYVATVFVNSSRILLAVFINRWFSSANLAPPSWLHLGEGIFIYLFFFILVYLLTNHILFKLIRKHEEPT